jgi:hypothetical protein
VAELKFDSKSEYSTYVDLRKIEVLSFIVVIGVFNVIKIIIIMIRDMGYLVFALFRLLGLI